MKMRNIAANMLTILIVLGIVFLAAFQIIRAQVTAPGPSAEPIIFTVERGARLTRVADRLQEAGAIDKAWLFRVNARLTRRDKQLKFGEYEIPAGASMEEVLVLLVTGGNVRHKVTVAEGLTSQEAVERILASDVLTGEIGETPAEGSLLPETYVFERGTTRAQIIERMQADMARVLDEAWEGRDPDLPLKSKEELLILASIIEKEALPTEHGTVASVFINRLNDGWRLQTDPTIIYGITRGAGPLGRPIRVSDRDGLTERRLHGSVAYNTYVIDGLPPTPICNPGRESIFAAANPEDTDYYFFVADGTGGHAFARTQAEHDRNVANWRRIEAERKANE